LTQQVGVVRVTHHDIEQVIGDSVANGVMMMAVTRWVVAEGFGAEKGMKEVVALR
jgi:phage terminase large subunit-like protein